MAHQQAARRKMHFGKASQVAIPDKLYFRIGDVSRLCDLPPYVLRFWETEFPQLKPNKGGTGQRLYRKRDVEMVLAIKRLLYGEGFTIAGARKALTEQRRTGATIHTLEPVSVKTVKTTTIEKKATPSSAPTRVAKPAGREQKISALRNEMREILSMLDPENTARTAAPPVAAKRSAKKPTTANEPTLF